MPHTTVTWLQLSKDMFVRIAAVRCALHKGLLCGTNHPFAALAPMAANHLKWRLRNVLDAENSKITEKSSQGF